MSTPAPRTRFGSTIDMFREEIDDLFRKMFGGGSLATNGASVWSPHVDVTEGEQEFVVKADLPGVATKDIDVSVTDGVLVLKGERCEEKREEKKGYQRYERFTGSFYREIPIPSSVDADSISAQSSQGVVTVRLPKKPELKPRKIAVQETK